MASTWQQLGSWTQPSGSVTSWSTGDFTAKKHLRIIFVGNSTGSSGADMTVRFNDDSGSNYRQRTGYMNGSTDDGGQTGSDFRSGFTLSPNGYAVWEFINILDREKLGIGMGQYSNAGEGNNPSEREQITKWFKTDQQITKITLRREGDTDGVVPIHTITVYGADDQPTTPFYPNLPNGTTFLTSDTNKLYMWDGTDTWNEVS